MARNKSIRYGDYIQAMSVDSHKIPYIELMPEPLFDRHGNEYPQPVPLWPGPAWPAWPTSQPAGRRNSV
ncbi:MAG: hypothetical protein VYC76_04655 [Pseudomonadota bacterium]|nr:hypothetical protein [Pseudomonadota bacterium]